MSNTTKIQDYVYAAAVSQIASLTSKLNQNYLDYDASLSQIKSLIHNDIADEIWEYVFDKLNYENAFVTISDEIVGNYYKISPQVFVNIVNEGNKDATSLIYKYRAIGPDFLTKALLTLASDKAEGPQRPPLLAESIPASDRVVTLSHNEMSEFEERASEIIESAEKLNNIEGAPGLREIIIGQLKAGRELVRAGSFRLYVIQVTLIDSLSFLAKRYEKEAIGALATALLEALIKHLGIST